MHHSRSLEVTHRNTVVSIIPTVQCSILRAPKTGPRSVPNGECCHRVVVDLLLREDSGQRHVANIGQRATKRMPGGLQSVVAVMFNKRRDLRDHTTMDRGPRIVNTLQYLDSRGKLDIWKGRDNQGGINIIGDIDSWGV